MRSGVQRHRPSKVRVIFECRGGLAWLRNTRFKFSRDLFDAVRVMHALPRPQSLLIRCGGAFLFTMLLAFALHATTGLGGAGMDRVFNVWVYDALIVGAAGSCLLRAAMIERERLAWGLLG